MIVSVASGKGGTGKTLVATSLALAASASQETQILDCDVEEPNCHVFVHLDTDFSESVFIQVPHVDESACTYCGRCAEVCAYHAIAVVKDKVLLFPELCHGCGACSYLCPESAISEEGRPVGVVEGGLSGRLEFVEGRLNVGEAMAPPVIRRVKEHIKPGKAVILDVCPGASCPVVEAVKGSDFCILVTEPTPFGLNDLALAVELMRTLRVPCGVVINRVGVGDEGVEEYCRAEGLPVLMKIPLERRIAALYSKGVPLVEGFPEWRGPFVKLFQDIEDMVAVR